MFKGACGSSIAIVLAAAATLPWARAQAGQGPTEPSAISRRVLAFYYPWYGVPEGPGGAGRNLHWGRIDAANHGIAESTHFTFLAGRLNR